MPNSAPTIPQSDPHDPIRIRDRILLAALPDVAFDGWTAALMARAAQNCGYDKEMAAAVFPGGLSDFVAYFSDWADRQMKESLAGTVPQDHRVRDRVRMAVLARIRVLQPWKEAVRRAMSYWAIPPRNLRATQAVWRTADAIWVWAGDTATDYNRYTKRTLLATVLGATMLAWVQDETADADSIAPFLDRRIETVMRLGQMVGRFKKQG
jgi:ubiquinone biosynthesis protein COQ9